MSDSLWPHGLCSLWNSPGQNTGVGSLSLLQGSYQPRDQTQVSCIRGRFFTSWAIREAHLVHKWKWNCELLSCVPLFVTLWTVACQASLSMGFSRQEYWNGLPFPSPWDLPRPGTEPGLWHCRQILSIWATREDQLVHSGYSVNTGRMDSGPAELSYRTWT